MQLFYLVFASVIGLLFVLFLFTGHKYASLVENLDSGEFPLCGLYPIGFCWSSLAPLALKGKQRELLVAQAKLLFDPRYAEYYANVVWAQFLTYVHLGLVLGFLLAGITGAGLMLVIGLAVAVLFGYYALNRMNDRLKTREAECTAELPEIVSTMALLINSGMQLHTAWRTIADSKEGTVYTLMRQACVDMDNGTSEVDAIHKFGILSNSADIRKFVSALSQSIERGGAELADFLTRQSVEIWALKKQLMLQKGEAAASKLLMPTVMLFIGIIIAVMTGALGMLI